MTEVTTPSPKKDIHAEVATLDYKDAYLLRKFMNSQGKIYPPKKHGLTAKEQRKVASTIKRSRYMALIPYTVK
jgi:small subunit ribosomal protein S18